MCRYIHTYIHTYVRYWSQCMCICSVHYFIVHSRGLMISNAAVQGRICTCTLAAVVLLITQMAVANSAAEIAIYWVWVTPPHVAVEARCITARWSTSVAEYWTGTSTNPSSNWWPVEIPMYKVCSPDWPMWTEAIWIRLVVPNMVDELEIKVFFTIRVQWHIVKSKCHFFS